MVLSSVALLISQHEKKLKEKIAGQNQSNALMPTFLIDFLVRWAVFLLPPCYPNWTSWIVFTVSPVPEASPPYNTIFSHANYAAGSVLRFWGHFLNIWCCIVLISDDSCPNTDSISSHRDTSSNTIEHDCEKRRFQQSTTSVTTRLWCQSLWQ